MKRYRRPSQTKLRKALDKAETLSWMAGDDTSHGRMFEEIINPIAWDHKRLRGLLSRALDALDDATGTEPAEAAVAIRKALEETEGMF
jgi:hypothetical protein